MHEILIEMHILGQVMVLIDMLTKLSMYIKDDFS